MLPEPLYSTENDDTDEHTQQRDNILGRSQKKHHVAEKQHPPRKAERQIGASVSNQRFRQQV